MGAEPRRTVRPCGARQPIRAIADEVIRTLNVLRSRTAFFAPTGARSSIQALLITDDAVQSQSRSGRSGRSCARPRGAIVEPRPCARTASCGDGEAGGADESRRDKVESRRPRSGAKTDAGGRATALAFPPRRGAAAGAERMSRAERRTGGGPAHVVALVERSPCAPLWARSPIKSCAGSRCGGEVDRRRAQSRAAASALTGRDHGTKSPDRGRKRGGDDLRPALAHSILRAHPTVPCEPENAVLRSPSKVAMLSGEARYWHARILRCAPPAPEMGTRHPCKRHAAARLHTAAARGIAPGTQYCRTRSARLELCAARHSTPQIAEGHSSRSASQPVPLRRLQPSADHPDGVLGPITGAAPADLGSHARRTNPASGVSPAPQ
jgi:hypothetical protein